MKKFNEKTSKDQKVALVSAIKDINKVLGEEIEPPLKEVGTVQVLTEELKSVVELVQPEDEIEKVTRILLEELFSLNGEQEEEKEEEEKEEEEEKKPAKKNKTSSTEKKAKTPGVIATIVSLIEKAPKKGISKEEILENLEKVFPDREGVSMKKTIQVQVPSRISKERFEVEKLKNGNYKKA